MTNSEGKSTATIAVALLATVIGLWSIRVFVQIGARAVSAMQRPSREFSDEYDLLSSVSGATALVLSVIAGVVAAVLLVRVATPDRRDITIGLAVVFAVAAQAPGYFLSGMLDDAAAAKESAGLVEPDVSHVPLAVSVWIVALLGALIWGVARGWGARSGVVGIGSAFLFGLLGTAFALTSAHNAIGVDSRALIWAPVICGLGVLVGCVAASADHGSGPLRG